MIGPGVLVVAESVVVTHSCVLSLTRGLAVVIELGTCESSTLVQIKIISI